MKIKIATDLSLPPEVVTLTSAILGIRNSGKTNTGVVITEGLLDAGHQVIVLDPLDVWWGLKSSADGKSDGYSVVIIGGQHADIPLAPTDGQAIAEFLAENRVPAVLSMRHLSKADQRRFVATFAEHFYHQKGKPGRATPVMIMIDEASSFVPQSFQGDSAKMVGAIEDLVRRGRASGVGVTLIDQRAASVNKDVLTQLELLIAHRHTSPQDRAALKLWVQAHDTGDQAAAFMDSLASLKQGEAWFWSPGWLDLFQRVQVRARQTFDSSATPKLGKSLALPKKLATVDLDSLKSRLASTIEKAKADDPRELRRRISELEKELKAKPQPIAAQKTVERFVLKDGQLDRAGKLLEGLQKAISEISDAIGKTRSQPQQSRPLAVIPRAAVTAPRPAPRKQTDAAESSTALSKAEKSILRALAQYSDGRTKNQAAVLTGYAVSGGGFNNALSSLRTKGYITGAETLVITQAGADALGPFDPLPTGSELLDLWRSQLSKAEKEILNVLAASYPNSLTKDDIASHTESKYAADGGGFNNALSRLRTLELISGKSEIKASDNLFD